MFKTKVSVLLVSFLVVNTTHASCYSVFKSLFQKESGFTNNEAVEFTERITRIERFTNFLRKGKEDPTPAINLKIAKKLNKLHENIFADNFSANEREWRTFFRTIEAQLIGFKRYKKISMYLEAHPDANESQFVNELVNMGFSDEFNNFIIKQLKDSGTLEKLRPKLNEEINSTLVNLGNNYQEYRMVRGNLEDLLISKECNEICKKQVNLLLKELGVNSEKESLTHPTFFKDQTRPSIEELRKLLYQEPLFVLTKVKRERNAELKSFFLSYLNQPMFVDSILGLIYKSDTLGRQKAVQLFKLIYDSHAQNVYFPKLNKIIFSTADAKANAQTLKGLNSTADQDELLITFARRADALAQEKWKAIKEYAEKFEKDFFEKLSAAEKKALARGEISPTRDKTILTKVALLTAAGAGTYAYFYFDGEPSSIEVEIESNEIEIPSLGGNSSTDLGEVEPSDRGVTPYERIDSNEKILLDGEIDQMIDEASVVIMDSDIQRDPSSLRLSHQHKSNLFTALWCTVFTCKASD